MASHEQLAALLGSRKAEERLASLRGIAEAGKRRFEQETGADLAGEGWDAVRDHRLIRFGLDEGCVLNLIGLRASVGVCIELLERFLLQFQGLHLHDIHYGHAVRRLRRMFRGLPGGYHRRPRYDIARRVRRCHRGG